MSVDTKISNMVASSVAPPNHSSVPLVNTESCPCVDVASGTRKHSSFSPWMFALLATLFVCASASDLYEGTGYYYQDFTVGNARRLEGDEILAFESIMAGYTPEYSGKDDTSVTVCDLQYQRVVDPVRHQLRRKLGESVNQAQYRMTWSSTAVDVSNFPGRFAGFVNVNRARVTTDLQAAGLNVTQSGVVFVKITLAPSLSPTTTQPPSFVLTSSPSDEPTVSMAPSKEPTLSPTTTQLPSLAPSLSPTITQLPSSAPTLSPSDEDSMAPSKDLTINGVIGEQPRSSAYRIPMSILFLGLGIFFSV